LPQFGVQTLGVPTQVKLASTRQALLQPSPLTLTPPPWSQVSPASRTPLPQVRMQALGVPAQVHPGSTVQVELQPSPFASAAPSSQPSKPALVPSPQIAVWVMARR
jgi:hypothetical protein